MRRLLLSPIPLALALAVCDLGNTAYAAERLAVSPEFLSASSGARWEAVGDDVLSHQTGKGAGGTMVSGLTLEILSQWQMPNGGSASAHGTLAISTNANNALAAQVATTAQASDGGWHGNGNSNGNANGIANGSGNGNGKGLGNGSVSVTGAAGATVTSSLAPAAGTGANPQASASGGQGVSVNGVSQITQVAGDGNVGANSTVIDFNGTSASTLAGNAGPSLGQGTNANAGNAASANSPTATATSASGNVKAGISFAGGGVSVSLQTPAGIATQTISPAGMQGGGSIAQLLQIAGNGQAVVNQLKLSVQTLPMSGALMRQLGVLQALQNSALLRR
ncbi:peptidase C39 [Trinickia sp.]|uniref:peptidase C39 n=1 Tax=Trinickia sp. TaxID=2571163 RepID=UPI003F806D2C